jgi:hypothetical protein
MQTSVILYPPEHTGDLESFLELLADIVADQLLTQIKQDASESCDKAA